MGTPLLRPCPYCGGEAYISEQQNSVYIDCDHKKKCMTRPSTWSQSALPLSRQIIGWNMRIF